MKQLFTSISFIILISSCGNSSSDNANKENNPNKESKETGPTADDIISKNIEARGGYDKIRSLQSVIFRGTITNKNVATPIVSSYEHLRGMKTEYTINGKTAYRIISTKGGWEFNPFNGKPPQAIDSSTLQDALFQLDIQGLFVDYKEKGYTAEYQGKDTALGKDCHKIRLMKKNEGDKVYLFDDDYLLRKTIVYRLGDDGKYYPGADYYHDYRKDANGYLFSYHRQAGTANEILYTSIITNGTIPASFFLPGK